MALKAAAAAEFDFERAVSSAELQAAYQPIVDLASREVVAFEALARWPGIAGVTPDVVFAAARENGRIAELDWECRLAALDGALELPLGRDHVLFVNVEPDTLGAPMPSHGERTLAAAQRGLRLIIELTERALVAHPAEVLRFVAWAREQEWGIALDDVGAAPESLALLPFLAPDVVKLDMSLTNQRANAERAAIMAAVMAHSERTGAVVLAEGIENQADLDQALALGATLGQGWLFGRPGPLVKSAQPERPIERSRAIPAVDATPFDVIAGHERLRVGRKGLLLDLSLHLESQGQHLQTPPVVLSAFQTAERFTPATATRYSRLGARCPLVAAFGLGLDACAVPGVLGAEFSEEDPLAGEWTVTVVGPHYAGALVARDLGDDGPDVDRRFEFLVTHDRSLVLRAARSLMARITSEWPALTS